jgi:transposase
MEPGQLLVGTDRWRVGTLALEPDGAVLLSVVPAAAQARCPACGTPSARRHSWYRRTALDLPWRGHAVRLRLWARRFFCDAPGCPRKVFAERFPGLLARYARRTEAVTALLLAMAGCAGGAAGARLARAAGVTVSPDTLRRLLRAFAPAGAPTPVVLGVDEFALGRPERYGLVLVDLVARRPVDVLPDQEASTLAGWLRRHPGVGVVARDRGQHVREGVTLGAPGAVQVADRFHLLRNVVDALDDVRRQRPHAGRPAGRRAAREIRAAPLPDPGGPPPWETPPAAVTERQPSPRAGPVQWARVRELRAAGQSVADVGQALGLTPRTVRRLLRRPTPPPQEYVQHRRVPRPLAPFVPYLQQRWLEGCRTGRVLTEELRGRGYRGSGTSVRSLIARWRPPRSPPTPPPRLPRPPVRCPLLLDPAALTEEERTALERTLEADLVLAGAYELVQQFRAALRARDAAGFEAWLQAAAASELAPFTRLAAGLLGDGDAVRNAFLYPWSTGPVEGHITRIKLLKRQGYGRAKLPLLRARVLRAN